MNILPRIFKIHIMKKIIVIFISIFGFFHCSNQKNETEDKPKQTIMETKQLEKITLAGGCFWCVESCFDSLKGVISVESGYSGGHVAKPTYKQVCTEETGHAEVVEITFDPQIISLQQILNAFWFLHNPTTLNQQGEDIGTQYRSAIFYRNEAQKQIAQASMKQSEEKQEWKGKYVTEITAFKKFWKAEDYHQNYYEQNPTQPYCNAVVGPKVAKFKQHFADWIKK